MFLVVKHFKPFFVLLLTCHGLPPFVIHLDTQSPQLLYINHACSSFVIKEFFNQLVLGFSFFQIFSCSAEFFSIVLQLL